MNIPTTTAATADAAPARNWKEFGKMCCGVVWSYLTYPSRKVSELTSWTFGKVKEMCAKYIAEPIRVTVTKTYAFLKAMVYGLAGTATICAALTGGLVYGGVFSGDDVKDVVAEIAPRSWVQFVGDYTVVPMKNLDGRVAKTIGLQ
jgi:hypothetical protein